MIYFSLVRYLLALVIRSCTEYPNSSEDVPRWLEELHQKLWGKRTELFNQVFRSVDLTADDFVQLQSELHDLDSRRNQKCHKLGEVLSTKIAFLRSRTATHRLTITSSPIPKVVLASELADAMEVDVDIASNPNKEQDNDVKVDAKGDQDDEEGEVDNGDDEGGENGDDGDREGEVDDGDDEGGENEDDEDREGKVDDEDDEDGKREDDNRTDKAYIDKDRDVLSSEPSAIFPCTIRFMDLAFLNLQHFDRVAQVLLIRDEWDAVVDIYNERQAGLRGSAILTGQPGSGKHYDSS
jgi:hypothetical protein